MKGDNLMKGLKKVALLALASTIGLSYGCGSSNLGTYQFPTYQPLLNASQYSMYRNGDMKKWTIMVHLGADNNLYSFGFKDMDEMVGGLKSPDINVIVLFDGTKQGDSAIYKITNKGKETVKDNGAVIPASKEIDSGDPKVLTKFTQFAIKNFPAEHYMLDIWDHGAGIFKQNLKRNVTRSFGYDDNGTNMETKDLGPILSAAAQTAGKKIDILGFDACLMGHLEIAYQVKDYCDFLVASEELEPGDGWDYKGWLAKAGNSGLTAPDVASALVDSYGKYYNNGNDATLSAVDINATVGVLVPAVNILGDALQKGLGSYKTGITTARDNTQSFYNSNCADLGDFLKNMKKQKVSAEIGSAVDNALGAYQKVIVRETHTTSQPGSTGMVVYFPGGYDGYNSTYDNVKEILFAQQPAWGNFLKSFTKK